MRTTTARRPTAAVLVVVVASSLLTACVHRTPADSGQLSVGPMIVLASKQADAWVRLLRADGMAARVGTLGEAMRRESAVVPVSVSLTATQQKRIRAWVSRGGRLVTPHVALLGTLGFGRESKGRTVAAAEAMGAGTGTAQWPSPEKVWGLRPGGELRTVLPVARDHGLALEATATLGSGRVLALALDPFRDNQLGHERLPWLGRQVAELAKPPAGPERSGIEIYFDPGGLRGPPGDIAALLEDVRVVHVAAWNTGFGDGSDYDYGGLISALHAKGVLVYAWLEPPFVNLKLWDTHPECREKTASGADADVDWRKLMALEDPKCFQLAFAVWSNLLTRFDWDGVNVAELYFEPDIDPTHMTPFHPAALRRFGHDPKQDPEGFLGFRSDLVVELNDAVLKSLNGLPNAARLDFQLTVVDDQLDPRQGRRVGSDVTRLADVARRNGASLQVEDPFTVWTEGPLRYDRLAPHLTSLMPTGQAFVDVNVVDREDAKPTAKMTGGELALATMSAGRTSGRVGIYSAGTVPHADLDALPAALGGSAETHDNGVSAPWSITARAPLGAAQRRLLVDGTPWPAGPGTAIIPPGEHRLDWSIGDARGPALLRLSAEIGGAAVRSTGLSFRYDSRAAPLAVFDREVKGVMIDGEQAAVTAVPGGEGRVIRLPAGNHQADIETA
jgi:hypothetical protein